MAPMCAASRWTPERARQAQGSPHSCLTWRASLPLRLLLLPRPDHHAGRRRQGAIANPVAADALDPVAIDRARTGADRGAGDRSATGFELVSNLRRSLGRGDAGARLPYVDQRA